MTSRSAKSAGSNEDIFESGASGLDALMDPRFGRCPFFVVVDLDSMSEISNANSSSVPGIQAAQEAVRQGAATLPLQPDH